MAIQPVICLIAAFLWNLTTGQHHERIVGGEDTSIREFPHIVSLQMPDLFDINYNHLCGGVIIDREWVLTAAHCIVFDFSEKIGRDVDVGDLEMYVLAGATDQTQWQRGQLVRVAEFHPHPGYNPHTSVHDIALLRLECPLEFNNFVAPIGLPAANSTASGRASLVGWGWLADATKKPARVLQHLQDRIMDITVCQYMLSRSVFPVSALSHMCTLSGYGAGCLGDSGGPLSQRDKVVGLVSWTVLPYGSGPMVFTKVSYYIDFIQDTLNSVRK